MRIEHIGRSTVKIILSGKELARSGLTVSDIDGKTPLSVMLLSGLIERIYPDSGSAQLNIEVFPSKDQGCVLYISPVSPEKTASDIRTIITADSVEKLVSVCRMISEAGITVKNSAVIGEKELLRLIADLPSDSAPLISSLMKISGIAKAEDNAVAHVMEHGSVIIPRNAVETVLRLASGENG